MASSHLPVDPATAANAAADDAVASTAPIRQRRAGITRLLLGPMRVLAGLIGLALHRIRYYSGLSVLALAGIILAVGLVTSAAFFAQAVDQVMMRREMAEYVRVTGRPPFSSRVSTVSSRLVPLNIARAEALGENVAGTLAGEVGLPVETLGMTATSDLVSLRPRTGSGQYDDTGRSLADANVLYIQGVGEQLDFVEGEPLDDGRSDGALDLWMHASQAETLGLQIGEEVELARSSDRTFIPARLAGTWQARDPDDSFWVGDPDQTLRKQLFVRRDDYIAYIEAWLEPKVRAVTWSVVLDEQAALPADAADYLVGFDRAELVMQKYLPDGRLTKPSASLARFVGKQTALTTLLLGFNVPALGFLLYFLILTSAVIAYWQRRETAILLSRGITKQSILGFTMIEAIVLFVVGLPIGLAFGILLARGMGYSVSFLSFEWRPALPVSIRGLNLPLIFGTLAVVVAAKLWATLLASRQTVVLQEREHARQARAPFWYRNYLDFLLILPTFYAYRQLAQRGSLGALVQDRPADLYQDPLLILVPALFIVTGALLTMRLFPLLMRLFDRVAGRVPSFTIYMALRQLGRQSQTYINPLLLVIVSLALGVYTLSMAASLDQWLEDRVFYSVGADLTFDPYLASEALVDPAYTIGAEWIPPIDEFAAIPGVEAAARVADYTSEVRLSNGNSYEARFLGIDRIDFPDVAWFRSDFARESLGSLMNRLAATPDGVLVSQRFLTENLLRIGDRINIFTIPDVGVRINTQFMIVGAYDFFPTVQEEDVAVVGNLEYIFSFFGLTMPHGIWLDLQEAADSQAVLAAVDATGIETRHVQDSGKLLREEQAGMERVGVFGTLSVSFLAAGLMAALGLLTFSYASLHERLFQFSLLRAMGLRRVQIVGQVALEYALLTLYGAVAGVWVGMLATRLFVPLFRVSTEVGAPLPPLLPIIASEQVAPLAISFALIMIVLEVLIISSAFYRRLFEALRMGHQG